MKNIKTIFNLVMLFCISTIVEAQHNTKIHVSINGNDSGSVGLINAPFRKIQSAINYALSGDTILVHPGRYKENLLVDGKDFFIYSEFQGTKDSTLLKNTIIDGDSSANAFILKNFNGEVNGFTIERGLSNFGAGLYILGSNNPIIRNCIIQKNVGNGDICGHGLVVDATNALVENCIVRNNWGRKWTIILGGRSTFRNSNIYNNTAWEETNIAVGSPATIYNLLIHHNVGGGLTVLAGSDTAKIQNLTVAYNTQFGVRIWGINTSSNTIARISNSIIHSNTGTNIMLLQSTAPAQTRLEIDYSIVQGGAAGIATNVYNILQYGSNNIDVIPDFVSDWNFHLKNTSPAIGKGKNTVAFSNFTHTIFPFDYDGNLRPNPSGSNPDIGAYESTLGTPIDSSCNYVFTTLPANASKLKNSNHIFNALHAGNYSYQWQANAAGLGWQNVTNINQYSGATTNNLSLSNINVSNHNQLFRIIAFKPGCADTSNMVVLTVNDVAKDSADLSIAKDSISKLNNLLANKHDTLYVGSNITTDTLKISIRTGLASSSPLINAIKVYPNPAASDLNIVLDKPGYYVAKLSGITGQTLVTPTSGSIDISNLANGVYILTIYDANNKLISTNKVSIIR